MSERLSGRFTDDEPGELGEPAEPAQPSEPAQRDERDELNVKEAWPARYMYIHPETNDRIDSEYDRLVYQCGSELDWKPKKNAHFYQVLAVHGLESVEQMGPDEFKTAVEELVDQ